MDWKSLLPDLVRLGIIPAFQCGFQWILVSPFLLLLLLLFMSNILERLGPDFSVSGVADPRVLGSLFLSMQLNVYGSWLMPECVWVRATNFQQVNVQNRTMTASFVVMTTITRREED